MITLLYKFKTIKLIELIIALLLVSCTNKQHYKHQINGDDSYLNTPPLKKLIIPQGMSLPLQNNDYDIPPTNQNGALGKELDISPPIQNLSLLHK